MSQFSRRAHWLNILFPQSVSPTRRDPDHRSDDVSMVQPYDGGGIGFQDIRTFCRRFVIPIGITGTIDMIVNDDFTIARIFAMDSEQLAGTDASVYVEVVSMNGVAVCVGYQDVTVASTNPKPFPNMSDFRLLGPGCTLRATTVSGGADSAFVVDLYASSAPLGTVFYN